MCNKMRIIAIILICSMTQGCASRLSALDGFPLGSSQIKTIVEKEPAWTPLSAPTPFFNPPGTDLYILPSTAAFFDTVFTTIMSTAVAETYMDSKVDSVNEAWSNSELQPRFDITSVTRESLEHEIRLLGLESRLSTDRGSAILRIRPIVLISFINDTDAYVFVRLAVRLEDSSGTELWRSKYFAGGGEYRPFLGHEGWTDKEAELLSQSIDRSVGQSIEVLLRDIRGDYSRSSASYRKIRSYFGEPYDYRNIVGQVLEQTSSRLIFLPAANWKQTGVFGIHILAPDAIEFLPYDHDPDSDPATWL